MTEHDDLFYIEHILESISKIEKSTKELSKESFINNEDIIDSTVRRLEVIGEAIKNVSSDLRARYKNIEWKKIAGFRDILIHRYFRVDLDTVWREIKEDLPDLKEKILKIREDLKK